VERRWSSLMFASLYEKSFGPVGKRWRCQSSSFHCYYHQEWRVYEESEWVKLVRWVKWSAVVSEVKWSE
jgi:DNA segregation ATPase FtsK/SpoIIIE-like protein